MNGEWIHSGSSGSFADPAMHVPDPARGSPSFLALSAASGMVLPGERIQGRILNYFHLENSIEAFEFACY